MDTLKNGSSADFLRAICGLQSMRKLLAVEELDKEICGKLRYPVRTILASTHITHLERQFLGYYFVDIDRREIWGLHPITYTEFVLFCLYVSCILFYKPKLSVSMWYTRHTFLSYGLDVVTFDRIEKDLIAIYDARTCS